MLIVSKYFKNILGVYEWVIQLDSVKVLYVVSAPMLPSL